MVEATTSASSDSAGGGTGTSAHSSKAMSASAFQSSFLSPKAKRKVFLEDEIKVDAEEEVKGAAAAFHRCGAAMESTAKEKANH